MENVNKKGFTLIELLVVVLIIGILVSMAMPRYEQAVLESRYANCKALAHTYIKAAKLSYMQRGVWPTRFDSLVVSPQSDVQKLTPTNADCGSSKHVYCCLKAEVEGNQNAGITCGTTDYAIGYTYSFYTSRNEQYYCIAKDDNVAAVNICETEAQIPSNIGFTVPQNLSTPVGHKTGYKTYAY